MRGHKGVSISKTHFLLHAWPCSPYRALLRMCVCDLNVIIHTHTSPTRQFSYGDINIPYKLIKPNETPIIKTSEVYYFSFTIGKQTQGD